MKKAPSSSGHSNRSGLLLIEIILAILFFSVVSAICLQLFVKAHNLGQHTKELDMAVRLASSTAELLDQDDNPMEYLKLLYPQADLDTEGGLVYLDENFQSCSQDTSIYQLDISCSYDNESSITYFIDVYRNEHTETVYCLELIHYNQYTPSSTYTRINTSESESASASADINTNLP